MTFKLTHTILFVRHLLSGDADARGEFSDMFELIQINGNCGSNMKIMIPIFEMFLEIILVGM